MREGDPLAPAERVDHRLGALADAALGHVEDAAQRHGVLGVGEDAQVGEDVADLAALVEADTADDLVGQADPDEDLFEDTGLGVGAVEDRDVAGPGVAGVGEPVDLLGDILRLVVLLVGDVAGDDGALAGLRPQVLGAAAGVALDDGVGGVEDVLGGAVVLLQQDGAGLRVVLLELEDVADRRAAEGVDRLVGVADHAEFGGLVAGADELADQGVLGVVGVLVLVDQDVPEAPPVVLGDVGERLEQVDGGHDDVVEVQRVGVVQPGLVHRVRLGELPLEGVLRLGGERLVVDQLVLEVGDLGAERLRRELLGVEIQVAADQGHQPARVGGVVDRERRGEAERLGLAAQDAHAGAVEGGHPHGVGARPDQLLDALLHLARGLVGEGDGEDRARVDVAGAEQVGDAVGEHAGLAGAGAGDDEQRPAVVLDGGALLLVEPHEELRGVEHGTRRAVAVVRVVRGRTVVPPLEQVVRDVLATGAVLRRRGLLAVGRPVGRVHTGQEVVVKEAAHRLPSLGARTDSPSPSGEVHTLGARTCRKPGARGARACRKAASRVARLPRCVTAAPASAKDYEKVSGLSDIALPRCAGRWLACRTSRNRQRPRGVRAPWRRTVRLVPRYSAPPVRVRPWGSPRRRWPL